MILAGKVFNAWELTGSLISTGSLSSEIVILSIHFEWSPPPYSIDSDALASGFELVLRNAEALDPLIANSFKSLIILSFKIDFRWPRQLEEEWDLLRTRFSQSAVEEALRMKLPNISEKIYIDVSVSHRDRESAVFSCQP